MSTESSGHAHLVGATPVPTAEGCATLGTGRQLERSTPPRRVASSQGPSATAVLIDQVHREAGARAVRSIGHCQPPKVRHYRSPLTRLSSPQANPARPKRGTFSAAERATFSAAVDRCPGLLPKGRSKQIVAFSEELPEFHDPSRSQLFQYHSVEQLSRLGTCLANHPCTVDKLRGEPASGRAAPEKGMTVAEVAQLLGTPESSHTDGQVVSNRYPTSSGAFEVEFFRDVAVEVRSIARSSSESVRKGLSLAEVERTAGTATATSQDGPVVTNTYRWNGGKLQADFYNGVLVSYRTSSE